MPRRKVLVVGATGKQGSAFIRAALAANAAENTPSRNGSAANVDIESPFHLIALTRNPRVSALPGLTDDAQGSVSVACANLDEPDTVRKVFEDEKSKGDGGIWGVFLVLAFPGLGADTSGEERQGKLVVDLAQEYGVHHLIYSSAEMAISSGTEVEAHETRGKLAIEAHIKSKEGLHWTIIRPGFFMENFDGVLGRITVSVLRVSLKKDTKLQLVAADDIGHVAVAVMRQSDAYAGQEIAVIGDALTIDAIQTAYKRGAGKTMPSVPNVLGWGVTAMNKHVKALGTEIERTHTRNVERNISLDDRIAKCRELYPQMHTIEAWANAPRTNADWSPGWNNVSLKALLQGKV